MTSAVLLLAPSRGLGGGIERLVATVESALDRGGVPHRRLDLRRPGQRPTPVAKARFLYRVDRAVRASDRPVRLVLAHRNLLPAVRLAARLPQYRGASVILHGSEVWSGRPRHARVLRRPEVRAVAVSGYTAGALARTCPATVLYPGVSPEWYDTLTRQTPRRADPDRLRLVTAFRLAAWRAKGLDILLRAVELLGDDRVRLTVCGTGPVPADLRAEVARHPWCRVAADLGDDALAGQLAAADLFVLCTRTRAGRGARSSGEGFGLALLEAQLAGTPVVAPAFGGSTEAFQPGITGLTPVDETPEALAGVLAELFADHAALAALGRAAADWARVRYEPAAHGRQMVRALLSDPAGDTPPGNILTGGDGVD